MYSLNCYFGLCCNISWSAFRLFHVQSPDWRKRWSRSGSFLCCIAAKLREQSVMKIVVIADPWLKEREEDSTRLSVFISPSHAVTRKGYLITLYHPSHCESNVTPLHQDEQSTRISFFCGPLTLTSCHPQGCLKMPFLVAASVFKQLACNPLKQFRHLDDNLVN